MMHLPRLRYGYRRATMSRTRRCLVLPFYPKRFGSAKEESCGGPPPPHVGRFASHRRMSRSGTQVLRPSFTVRSPPAPEAIHVRCDGRSDTTSGENEEGIRSDPRFVHNPFALRLKNERRESPRNRPAHPRPRRSPPNHRARPDPARSGLPMTLPPRGCAGSIRTSLPSWCGEHRDHPHISREGRRNICHAAIRRRSVRALFE